MIPKPYDWDEVFMNTQSIALIETARKILSKILSDHILVACSKFDILQDDNFSVLKEIWLVLQDMQKAYDSVRWYYLRASLWCIKMCKKFIRFFGGIYKDRINRVITDFGLSGDYKVHDGLDQGEVFSPLLWRIFYDLLLCKVKRHEQLCGYQIDTKFVSKTGRIESGSGLTLYFLAGAFVDDTIWVGNCQASTQYALNIASEFFMINNISINSEKTVAIPINQSVKIVKLSICGQPILIAKKGEAHHYLSIFLLTEGLSKLSIARAYADMHFFVNVVLRKTITDKQFLYLVLAVLQPIVSYRIQFSFVSSNVCHKWNVLVRKGLRSKACLLHDFPDATLHHLLLYDLKLFEQVQSEGKVAALIMFSNVSGVLGHLFSHGFLDLQVLGWALLDLLSGHFLMFTILEKSLYFDLVISLRCFGVAFGNRLFDKKDLHGLVSHWFAVSSEFLRNKGFLSSGFADPAVLLGLDILGSGEFSASGFFEIFMNESLKNFGSAEVANSATAYFSALNLSVGIAVQSLLSFTMAKLQAIVLSLECVVFSSTVVLHLNSQAAIDACIERRHIFNLVKDKDFSVSWVKVKGYSEVSKNVEANLAAGTASGSPFSLLAGVHKHFLVAEDTFVSSNAHYFVSDIFCSVCYACWEAGLGFNVVPDAMIVHINWVVTAMAVHRRLLVVVRKRLYDRCYLGVLCLLCGGVEFSDHSFTCTHESGVYDEILAKASAHWSVLVGVSRSFASAMLWWYKKTYSVLDDKKVAIARITDFVRFVVELYCAKVWLVRSIHQIKMEKTGLVHDGSVISGLIYGVFSVLSNGVVRLLGLTESFAVCFSHQRLCGFFFGLGGNVLVYIGV
ncbi:hypothetical protein G9A89_011148 [Geosiphon pyriformis]|nr:hypothetical protein G9A89_011148 [Geosiphon pyriformis]